MKETFARLAVAFVCSVVASSASFVFASELTDPANFSVVTNDTVATVRRIKDVNCAELHQSFPDGDLVSKLLLWIDVGSMPACFFPDAPSALPDGIQFANGQWRFKSAGALGTGTVFVGSQNVPAQLVCWECGAMDVTNKFVFGYDGSGLIATSDSAYYILRSLGVTNNVVGPWLGRASGKTRMTLALTEDSNEYLRQIQLSGAFSPFAFDGGTLRIAAQAKNPFFSYVGEAADKTASRYVFASTNTVTFDAQHGADTRLGIPLNLDGSDGRVYAEPPIANCSFEEGETGWSLDRANGSGAKVGVKTNGDTTWALNGCSTPYGTNYYTLRCLHQITSTGTIALTAASDWYVSLFAATRSGGHGSEKVQITVKLTESTSGESYEATTPQQSAAYEFKEFKLGPYDLPAGDYKVAVSTSWPGVEADPNKWSAVSVDNIQLFRPVDVPATVVKTGEGRVAFDGVAATETEFTVREGTLALLASGVTNTSVSVAANGTFELAPELVLSAEGLTVSVVSNGTFTLNDRKDQLVRNACFEQNSVESHSHVIPLEWNLQTDQKWTGSENGSGLQRCGGTLSPTGPYSEYGSMTTYLRNRALLTQTVTVPAAGNYRFSFVRARRDRSEYDWGTFHFKAYLVQGGVTNSFDDISLSTTFERFATTAELAAGSCKICFETYGENTNNGSMAFVDDVSLSRIAPLGEVTDVRVDLASGAKVRLENAEKVCLKNVFVDGVRVNGGIAALRRAGVEVSGTGKLSVGETQGMIILVK